jgi:hypothetical protein
LLKASDVIGVLKQNNFVYKGFPFIETYRIVRSEKLLVRRTELFSGCIAIVSFTSPEQIRKGQGHIKTEEKTV